MDNGSVTVMVTGGGGYIGSHACLQLLSNGYKVIALDNMKNCSRKNGQLLPESLLRVQKLCGKKLEFHDVDLLTIEHLEKVFSTSGKIDVVIHFAALKAVGESCQKPLQYYKNNLSGTIALLELMEKFDCKKIIYSSSATVYGTPAKLPITEKDPSDLSGCSNPYGKTKSITETILQDISSANKDWSIISLRYFNPVGAHPSGLIGEDPTGLPNNLMPYISQVAAGHLKCLSVYGSDYKTKDGTGVRDYIHIEDLVYGHIKALEKLIQNKSGGYEVYNLGTGNGYTVLEVIKAFEKASGINIPFKITDRRAGDVAESYCDASLALSKLGWRATKNLDDMCGDTWRWQSQNPKGYSE